MLLSWSAIGDGVTFAMTLHPTPNLNNSFRTCSTSGVKNAGRQAPRAEALRAKALQC